MGGETKFIPLTGVTLPLVSYGGSSVLSTLIMFGIIEMIFILHDERTARFKERYEMEHQGWNSYENMPDIDLGGVLDNDADPPGSGSGTSGAGQGQNGSFPGGEDSLPEGFPVNGISEEGIFDGYEDGNR